MIRALVLSALPVAVNLAGLDEVMVMVAWCEGFDWLKRVWRPGFWRLMAVVSPGLSVPRVMGSLLLERTE